MKATVVERDKSRSFASVQILTLNAIGSINVKDEITFVHFNIFFNETCSHFSARVHLLSITMDDERSTGTRITRLFDVKHQKTKASTSSQKLVDISVDLDANGQQDGSTFLFFYYFFTFSNIFSKS